MCPLKSTRWYSKHTLSLQQPTINVFDLWRKFIFDATMEIARTIANKRRNIDTRYFSGSAPHLRGKQSVKRSHLTNVGIYCTV